MDAANLFIKNSRALHEDDKVEVARELTDLRVQLREAQQTLSKVEIEVEEELGIQKETTITEWCLFGLCVTTLILLGISYIYI